MKKIKFKWTDLTRRVVLVLLGIILGVNVYLTNAQRLVGNQLPMPFGYGAAMVLSGSMEPTFYKGDLIIVKEQSELAVDDIVVFEDNGSLVVHRIVALDDETVTTKGDANNVEDDPISRTLVKGRVLFWIPYAGEVVSFLKTPLGTAGIIALAIALVEIPRRREKQADDEEQQKLIDEIKRLKSELEE